MRMDPNTFAIDNPFVGEPRPELDHAWDELLQSMSEIYSFRETSESDQIRHPDNRVVTRVRAASTSAQS